MENSYVKIWEEKVVIPTYGIGKAEKNPMFFEKRVYQGSSGVVYPNPVVEKIYDEKEDKEYTGLFLENEFIKVMILPELGGRIQMAYDKVKERHFIYYNQVIKPALVGLTGPWISGGIEFNWPQHHRPSTFSPVDYKIEENADGSKTVWVNEIEQMFHTKGMAGFTVYPDKAYIEIKAKLLNRSELPQTFLWWANPAVKVNDDYQSVFPPDVNAVFDHGKRDVSTFPIATGTYYKVDYSPGTDISMYKNIPVPTSYMAINSEYDFVGGYEHDSKGGLLHVANHHVSPGKKQWTWGHSDFGQAWDRNLTDEDGPYIELMTGMFTDNQPDFTWLMPNEEKSFTQYFMPYRELGLVKNATKDILVAVHQEGTQIAIKVYATSLHKDVKLVLSHAEQELLQDTITVSPRDVYEKEITVDANVKENALLLELINTAGKTLIKYDASSNKLNEIPQSAKAALLPEEIESNEQLFLTGQHLEQYRHATYSPVPYYEEALKRDPKDSRNNNALGLWYLRRGQFEKSESYFRKAVETITERNPNPYDSEAYYNLGLSLKYQGKQDDAYKSFYKATWSNAWNHASYFSVAQIDIARADYALALEHLTLAIDFNARNSKSYVLKAAAYRHLGKYNEAIKISQQALERDGFNLGALNELHLSYTAISDQNQGNAALQQLLDLSRGSVQNFLAYAQDYLAAGLYDEATGLLKEAIAINAVNPLVYYYLAYSEYQKGNKEVAQKWFKQAAEADSYLCFPNRLFEIVVLNLALEINPKDAKAAYYLGNLFYDKRQYAEAIAYWEQSINQDPYFPTAWRNLGIAYFNKSKDQDKALVCFEKAFELDPKDSRILMELDQLYKKLNRTPEEREVLLSENVDAANQRDDVYLERIAILNFKGAYAEALELINNRKFHPWEGGEGKVSGQYVTSLVELAKAAIAENKFEQAIDYLERAQVYPHNLGEGKLFGAQENDIFYWLGCAYEGLNREEEAKTYFKKATIGLDEPAAAIFYNDQQPDQIFYQGLAWKKLGDDSHAQKIFGKLVQYGNQHQEDEVKIDYFAVSLPNLLIFEDDLNARNKAHCLLIEGLGYLGQQDLEKAEECFNAVLKLDAEHAKAKIHLNMVTSGKLTVSS